VRLAIAEKICSGQSPARNDGAFLMREEKDEMTKYDRLWFENGQANIELRNITLDELEILTSICTGIESFSYLLNKAPRTHPKKTVQEKSKPTAPIYACPSLKHSCHS
jgi:hypothetical protein